MSAGHKIAVDTTGNLVATTSWVETPAEDLTPGVGEVVVEGQRMIQCTPAGAVLSSASVLTFTRITITGGTRAGNGSAVSILAANAKRVGFEVYAKSGTSYLGGAATVDSTTGRPLLPTNSREMHGLGVYLGALYAADDGTHDCDLSVWEWSNP